MIINVHIQELIKRKYYGLCWILYYKQLIMIQHIDQIILMWLFSFLIGFHHTCVYSCIFILHLYHMWFHHTGLWKMLYVINSLANIRKVNSKNMKHNIIFLLLTITTTLLWIFALFRRLHHFYINIALFI